MQQCSVAFPPPHALASARFHCVESSYITSSRVSEAYTHNSVDRELSRNARVPHAGAALQPQCVLDAVQHYQQEEAVWGGYETQRK
jgi:hypothetical protein